MRETDHLYPLYLVHERSGSLRIQDSDPFIEGDPLFLNACLRGELSEHWMRFRMFTDKAEFYICIEYEDWTKRHDLKDKGIMLLFDPEHTRRKHYNAFVFTIQPDAKLKYEEYRNALEPADVPPGVAYQNRMAGGICHAEIRIPLSLMRIVPGKINRAGFNAVRTYEQAGRIRYAVWSGIKGDKVNSGQGMGDLLFTCGMNPQHIGQCAEEIRHDSDLYFTKWEKRKIPQEMYSYIKFKQRGLTGKVKREDIARAKENAETTAWGRKMKAEIVKVADYWAGKSDDELFDLVPAGNPRALSVSQSFGDPLTGGKRTALEVCLERPYCYYNPISKMWWHNGAKFNNPATGEEHELQDDGSGFLAPAGFPNAGIRYMFTASYRLFILSMLMGNPYCAVLESRSVCAETTGKDNCGAISHLAFAYHLTGNVDYAYKALILIGRIAELVPYMNGNYASGYYDTVQISEPTTTESFWLSNYFDALDLLYDTIDEVEPRLQQLFRCKPDAENRERTSPFQIKAAVHEMIPSILLSCEIERARTADWSLRYIYLEIILASFMESGKLMDKVLRGDRSSLASKMRNNFFRDGRYHYDSMGYVALNCEQIALIANNNYRFRDEEYFPEGIDMFEEPAFELNQVMKLYAHLKCGGLTPMFGDTLADNAEPISAERKQGKFAYSQSLEIVFRRMPSVRTVIGPVLAQYSPEELEIHRARSIKDPSLKHALLLLAAAADWGEYQQYKQAGRQIQPSYLLQDSETSFLRAGTNTRNCKHAVLYGQPSAGHKHGDKLGLWIGAYGYHLQSSAGCYPFTWFSPKYHAWEEHSAACTVVVVDGRTQEPSYSRLKCHYEGNSLQLAGMENETAYPGTHLERWCWLVQAPNDEDAYVLDLNYVAGGCNFDYNSCGLDLPADRLCFEGVNEKDWVRLQGTMAGPDVELYSQPGYGWMKAIRKVRICEQVSWIYSFQDAALKTHAVSFGKDRELICSLGEKGGSERAKSAWSPFVQWRDAAEEAAEHSASFVNVLEPYEHEAFLDTVRPMELLRGKGSARFNDTGVEVKYKDGHKDLLIASYSGAAMVYRDSAGSKVETDARALLLRYKGGILSEVEAIGYSLIRAGDFHVQTQCSRITGHVSAVDIESRIIQVDMQSGLKEWPKELKGRVALIDSPDYLKPSPYYLLNPRLVGNQLTFTTDMSLIKLEADWPSPQKRLGLGKKMAVDYHGTKVYIDVKPGDSFVMDTALYCKLS